MKKCLEKKKNIFILLLKVFANFYAVSFYALFEKKINHLLIKNNVVELLTIEFVERNKVKIIDGPLVDLERKIVKYNFHKRVVYENIKFGSATTLLQLGIDMIEKG